MINQKNFAVLIDGENCSPKQFSGILKEVQRLGSIAVKRVYADWTNPARSSWKEILHLNGARPIQQFDYGKDAADHALIMDAVEILTKTPEINAVCIASSDNGFQFLAQRIREMGKYVLGVGRREPPAKNLIAACHSYVYYDNLPDANNENDFETTKSDMPLEELLVKAYNSFSSNDEQIYLGDLGKSLKDFDPAFDPRSYGFASLKKLVKNHPEIISITEETSDRCFITLAQKAEIVTENTLNGTMKRWCGNFGFIEGDDGHDYYFCKTNVTKEQRDDRFKVGQRFTFTVSKKPDPEAEDNATRNGKVALVMAVS
ncbi:MULTISPECIES: NYN domain-containing protein [Endozoicomonas]|uniref:NYN domain-containing protein n=2 Tax=Endozoicomonadaceae TaxID=2066474 RepID=UPI0013D1F379|nr:MULTISPECIES: NYN domain-containing protein [Endozoicomonas]USE38690.1 NYN domain-containing protein [Endozoicomonas sp. SCSIO W0465]